MELLVNLFIIVLNLFKTKNKKGAPINITITIGKNNKVNAEKNRKK